MRPDLAIVLDELAGLANDAWEAYDQAGDEAGQWHRTPDLAALLHTLGAQRRAMACELERQVALTGHRPRDRDTNPGTAHRLLARLRGTFVGDRGRALIEECERADTVFAHRLATTDERLLPEGLPGMLRTWHAEVVAALGQLAVTKVRLRGH